MKALYYFRNDFRINDNSLLSRALKESSRLAFLAKAPSQSWGEWRIKFYTESLISLSNSLREKGFELAVLNDEDFKKLNFNAFDVVYTPLISASYEQEEKAFIEKQTRVESDFNDRLLNSPPFGCPSNLPDVFTEFRKAIEQKFEVPPKSSYVKRWPEPLSVLKSTKVKEPSNPPHSDTAFPFLGGEQQALQRVEDYFFNSKNVLSYKESRNGLVGTNYSTKFSPYLSLGCISPSEIFRKIEQFEAEVESNQSTYWVKFELWWREYFRWVYEKYPNRFFLSSGIKQKEVPSQKDKTLLKNWIEGITGDDFVDANMRELKMTGWMSNRGRQNVASFLVKDLKLPWIWGANYFENQLIDYDVYSNWGNWQYVAGIGNDPRPNRYFNTEKQARMYDPNFEFRNLWLTRS